MSDWEGVTEFVAVVESQGFTAAAKVLNTSVAQVSRKISALEARLGAKLLHRTTRKVSVTEAGHTYYAHCRGLVEGLREAERALSQLNNIPQGKLKITTSITYGEHIIAPLLNEFLAQYPKIELDFVLSNQNLDLIEQDFDLAIRLGHLEDSSMMAKRLASRQVKVCAAPGYVEKYGEPHSLSELEQHNCLIGQSQYWRFQQSQSGNKAIDKSVRVTGNLRCNSGIALLDAAINGIGLVQLPDFYVDEAIEQGKLIEVLVPYRESQQGIWAVYPNNRHLSVKVSQLITFLSERLA
ncbi:LysR family transcriptional regulator [Vibrio tubiashii]|nr:LysR family transcriptional regulator [Vibrio tubiashii]